MNTIILSDISKNLLGAWYLDLQFLVNTIEENNLDADEIIQNVEMNFWKESILNINNLIYEALTQIAYRFIESNSKLFEEHSDEYEIFTNYMDSHIWFEDNEVQTEFEKFY